MTKEEAKEIVNIPNLTLDIEDAMFGDGSVTVQIANVFDSKDDAKEFIEALHVLCY